MSLHTARIAALSSANGKTAVAHSSALYSSLLFFFNKETLKIDHQGGPLKPHPGTLTARSGTPSPTKLRKDTLITSQLTLTPV